MTRDTQRLQEEYDHANDAPVYTALWATAQFPRLPEDAPNELRNLTIEIDDPKRVYAIHRGARRHNFQLLVERLTLQIRYGCTSRNCTTKTCFSCRKRLAAGAPVRRYNATSARTLAVYLASQDNPEQSLCHNPRAPIPAPSADRSGIARRGSSGGSSPKGNRSADKATQPHDDNLPKTIIAHTRSPRQESEEDTHRTIGQGSSKAHERPNFQVLEEPTQRDHRSFVQNVFGTTAFKLVEWLTPRNLQILAQAEEEVSRPAHNEQSSQKHNDTALSKKSQADGNEKESSAKTKEEKENAPRPTEKVESAVETQSHKALNPVPNGTARSATDDFRHVVSDPTSKSRPAAKRKTSHVRTTSDSIDMQKPKSILSISPKTDSGSDGHFSQSKAHTKQKVIRQALMTSPSMHMPDTPDTPDVDEVQPTTTESVNKFIELEPRTPGNTRAPKNGTIEQPPVDAEIRQKRRIRTKANRKKSPVLPPQSLSYLPIVAIDLLCDIMEIDGTAEKHSLHPLSVPESIKWYRVDSNASWRSPDGRSAIPQSIKLKWQAFIEQSLFDVLGRPDSLLKSFRYEGKRLLDSQTIWYLMLRMTRVAPSLVLDSLWGAAETLFRPPEKVETAFDNSYRGDVSIRYVTNNDAAQIINICLHALVASAPLVHDSRQLMNMSRIRSYGLAMLGRDSSSLEPTDLCLQYEDAFTNDSAIRLARRLFSAITTRRRFSEILELQKGAHENETQEADIMDTILETLKFLDFKVPPVLNFCKADRDLHETRVTFLILDWARTVMIQEWQGKAEMPCDGPFGGALTTMAAMYKNRKSLLLGDIHFRTEYFSERLDQVTMPREWLNFEPNKRTLHLLDHPYLFNPSTMVTYFRSINFSRMNHSYETARATIGLMNTAMASNHNLIVERQRRERLLERLRPAASSFLVLDIRRTDILLDTFNLIWRREERELMRPLKIRLGEEGGEEGMDAGGVQQEFFRLAVAEALNPDYGTFTIDDRTKMTWFQPGSPEPLWKFELIGNIFSLAIYNGLTLPITFPKAFYRKLLGEDVCELHHISDGWPDLASGLTTLLEWDEKDGTVEDVFARTYEFSAELFGKPISREMGPPKHWPQFSDSESFNSNPDDAPLVTNENRNSYVSDYIRWLTDISIQPQFEAFKSGFFACIDHRSLKLFDPSTLQSVVEGIQEIDVSELRRTTRYIGYDASDRTIRDFWSIVKKYDLEHKKKLLEFVTASDRVPVGGMRNVQFTLQKNGVGDGHLPTSYTCFGILLLPEYSSKEVLRERLGMSLENAKGFGFA